MADLPTADRSGAGDLVGRLLDRRGPRYTSYPTADRFVESFGADAYRSAAARRSIGGARRPLSLYVHLPFCRDICFYCACNKIVTRNAVTAARYLDYLRCEIGMQAALFREDPRVLRMHWGGGTPTYYDLPQLRSLWRAVADAFVMSPRGDYSIEVDPRTVDADAIAGLRDTGFNRVSFGVQDFDPRVQQAIHRAQSEETTLSAIRAARNAGFVSVNVDLVYGLPRQTEGTLASTLGAVVAGRPHRIALYNYAHLPTRFKSQRRIAEADLPSGAERLALFVLAETRLGAAGYVAVGMDHFALAGDALATAQLQGRLRRNFQGYTADEECDLVGLGASSIGAVGPTYSQNHRDLRSYYESLDRRELAVVRGIELTADDLLRRAVIESLMCRFAVSKETVETAYLIYFDRYFARELAQLAEYRRAGLIEERDGWIEVTARGRPLIRAICMIFDRYLQDNPAPPRYSRVF